MSHSRFEYIGFVFESPCRPENKTIANKFKLLLVMQEIDYKSIELFNGLYYESTRSSRTRHMCSVRTTHR